VLWWEWLLVSLAVLLLAYAAFVGWLVARGRREDARALASFIPDRIVLVSRMAREPRVPRRRKLLLLGLVAYLALHLPARVIGADAVCHCNRSNEPRNQRVPPLIREPGYVLNRETRRRSAPLRHVAPRS
jgi:hypothetical protein